MMADTLQNVPLTANTWVDLYAATGIVVGTAIIIQNLGGTTIRLNTKATSPLVTDGYNELTASDNVFGNASGDSGAWAYSPSIKSLVNVQEA